MELDIAHTQTVFPFKLLLIGVKCEGVQKTIIDRKPPFFLKQQFNLLQSIIGN